MKLGIYYAFWEKEWGGNFLPYIQKVKDLGFDILEVACGNFDKEPEDFFCALREEAERRELGEVLEARPRHGVQLVHELRGEALGERPPEGRTERGVGEARLRGGRRFAPEREEGVEELDRAEEPVAQVVERPGRKRGGLRDVEASEPARNLPEVLEEPRHLVAQASLFVRHGVPPHRRGKAAPRPRGGLSSPRARRP